MEKLTPADVLDLDAYLARRDEIRPAARAARAARRIQIGDRLSLTFENRETVLFQIEEMIRVEQIRDPAKIAEEVEVYNDLVAGEGELRATFFVEITDRSRIRADLDSLVGLERAGLWLEVDGARIPAEFEPGHAREDRISAVHFVRFVLGRRERAAIASEAGEVALVVDHPAYRARAVVGAAARAALADDLGLAAARS